jgi:PTH1 family peptidyl-tRNA hydrolase
MLFKKTDGGPQWIAVFLGNPGEKYAQSRHNMGFQTADAFCRKQQTSIRRLKFSALTGQCSLSGNKVFLMKPQTYMNLSGDSVIQAVRWYHVPAERVLVVSDDVDLEPGRIRVRKGGSAGGHNGLKSIIARLGTDAFPRIRVGVGAPESGTAMPDWVLSGPSGSDAVRIRQAIDRAADAVACYICEGPDRAMNQYNGVPEKET